MSKTGTTKKNPIKRIFNIIGNIAFVLLLIIAVFTIVTTVLNRSVLGPNIGGYKFYSVLSGSMEPSIKTGALTIVKPIDIQAIKIADVITFKLEEKPGTTVTHRVIAIDNSAGVLMQTKGDANEAPDKNFVSSDLFIGKVLFSIPYAGYLMEYSRTKIGFFILVFVPGMIIVLVEIIKLIKYFMIMERDKIQKSLRENEESIAEEKG